METVDLYPRGQDAEQIQKGKRQPSRTFVVNALDVRDIRESRNLSQNQFAALVHVSVKTLRNWEQGIHRSPQALVFVTSKVPSPIMNSDR